MIRKGILLSLLLVMASLPGLTSELKCDGFRIFIWPYQTDVLEDYSLYRELNLGGFQIDKGKGQHERIRFSVENDFPFYAGHVADKGYLYLKGQNRDAVTGKPGLLARPVCLSDPEVIRKMKKHIHGNIIDLKQGNVMAYALDDEISLGTFVNPADVDVHPLTLERFRDWLKTEYGSIDALNRQWETRFKTFSEVWPKGFVEVRKTLSEKYFSNWNLSGWIDFRHFMDIHFSEVLANLVKSANEADPLRPAGFVGAQAPSPWGGYDYGLLSESVQWMEAYDIHGTNEILRSFWNGSGKKRMQTFFSKRNLKIDSWFLWYYLLHGNSGAITWPEGWFYKKEGGFAIDPYILGLKDVFKTVQGDMSLPFTSSGSQFVPDPIGIYYSHASVQAGWVMDALVHGKTWPSRLSSIDDENQSSGVLRKVWCKSIEDVGLQYDFINYQDVLRGRMDLNDRFKVIILPKTVCLSDKEAQAFKQYVEKGGVLIADYLCGIFDEHGKFREKGALDDLFGIQRDDRAGYLNGKGVTEIDAEKYMADFSDRFTFYKGADYFNHLVIVEKGIKQYNIQRRQGLGRAYYFNLSPLEYWGSKKRSSGYGDQWRGIISHIFEQAGVFPRVRVQGQGDQATMIEAVFWKKGDDLFLGLIKNPSDMINNPGTPDAEPTRITMRFRNEVALFDMKHQKDLGRGKEFADDFNPWEANLYQVF